MEETKVFSEAGQSFYQQQAAETASAEQPADGAAPPTDGAQPATDDVVEAVRV